MLLSSCLNCYLTLTVPLAQSESFASWPAFRVLHWSWHSAHACTERFAASSSLRRLLCLSSRHRRLEVHALPFGRCTTLGIQSTLGILAFLALPCWSLSHDGTPMHCQQDSDTGDQPWRPCSWRARCLQHRATSNASSGSVYPRMLSSLLLRFLCCVPLKKVASH